MESGTGLPSMSRPESKSSAAAGALLMLQQQLLPVSLLSFCKTPNLILSDLLVMSLLTQFSWFIFQVEICEFWEPLRVVFAAVHVWLEVSEVM